MADQAKSGDTVHVHYRGTLDDGTEFDSSAGRDPLVFTLGEGNVIAGFDAGVEGMTPGEKKSVRIEAANAYGEHRDELVFALGREQMPPGSNPEVGDVFRMGFEDGSTTTMKVSAVDAERVTLDANHPLAGKNLTFELELVAIE